MTAMRMLFWISLACLAVALYPHPKEPPIQQMPDRAYIPCSFLTPGSQAECKENGKIRPAGPAAARQEKYFNDCRARGVGGFACLKLSAKVK